MSRTIRRKKGYRYWRNKSNYSTDIIGTGETYTYISKSYKYILSHTDREVVVLFWDKVQYDRIVTKNITKKVTLPWEVQENLRDKETRRHERDNSLWSRSCNKFVKEHSRRESRRFATRQIYSCIMLDNEDYFIHNNRYLKRIWWIYD